MRRIRAFLAVIALATALDAPATAQTEAPKPSGNLKVTARPAPDAPPFTNADQVEYIVYRQTADGHAGEMVDTGYGSVDSEARFSLPPGRYVVAASIDLARAETLIEIRAGELATADIVLPAGVIEARAMAAAGKPLLEPDTRWTVVDVFGRKHETVGPSLSVTVSPGPARITAALGNAGATAAVTAAAAQTEQTDVVIDIGMLILSGKRSAGAKQADDNIRWDLTSAVGEPLADYGNTEFRLAAGAYRVKATIGLASGYADVEVAAGGTTAKEFVVPAGRVTARAFFAADGPPVTENPRLEILDPEPGADGEPKIIASASSDRSSFDLPPGDYVLRATADIVSGETAFSLDAGEAIEVSVALGAGVLTVNARGGKRLDVLSREKDIYGKQAILATRHAESATLTLPAGALEVMVTRSDGSEQRLPATVVAGERTDLTFE
jgi:hypothetical protein